MNTEYNRTHLGDIRVHNEVIKNIALKAATEIRGIHKIRKSFIKFISNLVTKKDSAAGVKMELLNNSEVKITLKLMIEYGLNIPYAAWAVQENVKKSVEYMTGLVVTEVIVKIVGMQTKKGINLKEGLEEEFQESLPAD